MRSLIVTVIIVVTFLCVPPKMRADETQPDAQQAKEGDRNYLTELCKTNECRKDTQFKLKKKDGSYFELNSELSPPVVQRSLVTIFPGETLFIQADIEGDHLTNIKNVKAVQHPEKTIKLSFWQEPSIGDGTGMILEVKNPFGKYLRYRLDLVTLERDSLRYTSSCPVIPGKISYEQWPYPIFQLVISNMRFVEGDEIRICK